MILLYIVTNYSIKQKVTKKKQTNQDNRSILGRAQIVQEQLKNLDSDNGDAVITESDELIEDMEIEEEEVGEQDILFKEAIEKFRENLNLKFRLKKWRLRANGKKGKKRGFVCKFNYLNEGVN